MSINVVLQNFM